jgi:hypothetical protein
MIFMIKKGVVDDIEAFIKSLLDTSPRYSNQNQLQMTTPYYAMWMYELDYHHLAAK